MVLEDDELRVNASATMDRVYEFVGLPRFDTSNITSKEVYHR